eukprot:TRINITY_DN29236_c0_g1_i1.p1 TRINITY_DN29236_c0_g1~~TRINITY_DN29236_c0_g1_i1.p1  ORF type:complete len:448 (+),score=69.59 TRINITY_DN29236_c0_g1_i1:144-1487(+)
MALCQRYAQTVSLLLAICGAFATFPDGLQTALQDAARRTSDKYNCSVSIALQTVDGAVAAAQGIVDLSSGRSANPSDKYAWGSVTKMFTAASIMKLISKGAFSLDSKVAPLVDPLLARNFAKDPRLNISSVEELWGDSIKDVTIRELLGMKTGVPDFDRAQPAMSGKPAKDPLRAKLYAEPDRMWSPLELTTVPWVAGQWNKCRWHPFIGKFCYSSTNYILLGLVLEANAGNSSAWQSFQQSSFLPPELKDAILFADKGAPKDYGAVHGYDRTSYNMASGHNNHDNYNVSGVFAGWTASNVVADAPAVARLAWEIFGPPSSVAPKRYVDQMVPSRTQLYGLGAFNLGFFTGHAKMLRNSALGHGWGHLGATYGYQSVAGYFPELNIAMAIATNIETDTQQQPAHALCYAYNGVAKVLLGKNFVCSFTAAGYYGGKCTCKTAEESLMV